MAYYTGSVTGFSGLRQALVDTLAGHGWAWDGSDEELTKDTARINLTTDDVRLYARGRVIPGSNTGGSGQCRIGRLGITTLYDIVWPAMYRIIVFDSPDEVYVIVNHSVNVYQWLAFGAASISVPGNGTWLGASFFEANASGLSINPNGGGAVAANPSLFSYNNATGATGINGFVHHQLPDSSGDWLGIGNAGWCSLLATQPNSWNSESVLFPLRAWCDRSENRISCVAELQNARHIRIDYYEPGQILTLGSDRWMVFPWYRKNINARDGGSSSGATAHTGTLGWAIRYDGP